MDKFDDFTDLYDIILGSYPDAEVKQVYLKDSCGCLSDVTLEPCSLDVDISTSIAPGYNSENLYQAMRDWAYSHLVWEGCDFCQAALLIDLSIYSIGEHQPDWIAKKPLVAYAENSRLYIGQDAVDVVKRIYDNRFAEAGDVYPFIIHVGNWTGERKAYVVHTLRKIDKYPDRIELYTNVGKLPLYPIMPVTTQDIIEAVEVFAGKRKTDGYYNHKKRSGEIWETLAHYCKEESDQGIHNVKIYEDKIPSEEKDD